ncbi:MAG: PepSY-associated TM helix domain-containing protein [Acidobacteria bacterium]|nr:PepSY-associated TM helix domain-containing protein [Acidobacteriota bacterium]
MYRLLRNTHLLLGLFFFSFVLLYGITAVHFAHPAWFKGVWTAQQTHLTIPPSSAPNARALARKVMEELDRRGELSTVEETPEGWSLLIRRIGTLIEVRYDRNSGRAEVKTRRAPFMNVLSWMHEHPGISYSYFLHNVWGVVIALGSSALLGLSLTGIFLWFKIHGERWLGSVLLLGGLAFGSILIFALRTA